MGCDACGGGCGTLTLGPVELALLMVFLDRVILNLKEELRL